MQIPPIAEIDPTVRINDAQDALELLVNYKYQDIDRMLVHAENLHPDFFDLKTGIAGDILQKFSNYDGYLGIVVDHAVFGSKSLNDFVYESNKTGRIVFGTTKEAVVDRILNRR